MFLRVKIPHSRETSLFRTLSEKNSVFIPDSPSSIVHWLNRADNTQSGQYLKNDHISTLIKIDSRVIKVCYANSFRNKIKTLYGRDNIIKEVKGNIHLRNIGLRTPNIYAALTNLNPFNPIFGILIMEYIENSSTLRNYWSNQEKTTNRHILLNTFQKNICQLLDNRIQLNDFGPHNIIATDQGELYWLDAIAYPSKLDKASYFKRFEYQFNRVIQSDAEYWTLNERKSIQKSLSRYPLDLKL